MEDKIKGKGEQIGGKAKEEIGKVAGDRSTEWGGKADQMKGKVREKIGDLKSEIDEKDRTEDEAEEESKP